MSHWSFFSGSYKKLDSGLNQDCHPKQNESSSKSTDSAIRAGLSRWKQTEEVFFFLHQCLWLLMLMELSHLCLLSLLWWQLLSDWSLLWPQGGHAKSWISFRLVCPQSIASPSVHIFDRFDYWDIFRSFSWMWHAFLTANKTNVTITCLCFLISACLGGLFVCVCAKTETFCAPYSRLSGALLLALN